FGTDTGFTAGTYRFTVTADDGFQLWVDYNNVLSTYNAPQPNTTLTVDVPLTAGSHHIQIDYREVAGNALLKMTWVNIASIPSNPVNGTWTAQYYSNANLSGSPFAVVSESGVSHQWGIGAPLNGMPADNFSVRFSTTQNLPAGAYGLQVYADDGVRVFVNGIAYIDQWHTVSGQTYSTGFNLSGGATNITVEYFESGYNAFIDFRLFAPSTGTPTTPAGATATVKTGVLNVRNSPSTSGVILTKIHNGETYGIVGRNDASTWWQINVNGLVGWVSGLFVNVANAGSVPVASGVPSNPPSQPTQFVVTAQTNLNLRSQANASSDSLLVIPRGQSATVLARSADNGWLKVNYNGVVGWVSIRFVRSTPPLNLNQIPVG
ncbi:MAG TPA: SH3 domain-containing protein, partial [Phototrophicaceae bacterium]|nr:SH3 domain-containing protein [Phototrophicaceae bacterium]